MKLTTQQLADYDRDGFLVFPELFSAAEVAALQAEVVRLKEVESDCVFREGKTRTPKIVFKMDDPQWPTYAEPFEALSRVPRALHTAQQILADDALYMHHYKLNMKAAIEGTVWQWHQDYMSWQMDGIASPDMTTMLVMLEETQQISGALYFLPGSHKLGRLEPFLDESTVYKLWATPADRMKEILAEHAEPVAIVGKPGTAAIFHCNLLHASGRNLSHRDRWAVYMCYNRCANRPAEVQNPRPEYVRSTNWAPIKPLPEDAIVRSRARTETIRRTTSV